MIKAITAIHGREMLVNAKPVEHRATEVNRLIRQDGHPALLEPIQGFADTRIERRAIKHVSAIIRQKHLQTCLNVRLCGFWTKSAPDQHLGAVADETSDLRLRQNRQIKLMANMIYRGGEVFFGVDQSTIEIKDKN